MFSSLRSRYTVKLLLLFILFLLLIIPVACTPTEETSSDPGLDEEVSDNPQETLTEPGQEIRSASMDLYSDDGESRWQLEADVIQRLQRTGDLELEPVDIEVFGLEEEAETEDPDFWLESEAGVYQEEEGLLNLAGSVQLESDRYLFRSANMEWEQTSNLISSDEATVIEAANFTARGGSFTATGDLESLTIYRSEDNPARVTWEEEDEAN